MLLRTQTEPTKAYKEWSTVDPSKILIPICLVHNKEQEEQNKKKTEELNALLESTTARIAQIEQEKREQEEASPYAHETVFYAQQETAALYYQMKTLEEQVPKAPFKQGAEDPMLSIEYPIDEFVEPMDLE
ncbi:uncharacterized protein MYCGRDRAFT_97242 [Zymoseptoria tritici IPO323]|uniref:Uncharacterized protein n=1 Tax=Zymoseptoria tritici (strain CBS 115943 / IPO323) TaxID=336722 RepID=F9XPK5_ZYMTI|nr:uncharacterized protein MYCGRDRAFT_97242 [Zymoseptoria tritici IPO323]EGP82815.1 hypothetical protein MYCGRDRAFT_97242 [Zymoseptoria tritici IPO323]